MKLLYPVLALALFAFGIFATRFGNQEFEAKLRQAASKVQTALPPSGVLVRIDGEEVTLDDLEFEFRLHTAGLPQPEFTKLKNEQQQKLLQERQRRALDPLRKELAAALVERRLLFKVINEDRQFDVANPSRLVDCLSDYLEAVGQQNIIKLTQEERRKLKDRICEQSLIRQYLEERLFAAIEITEEERRSYFDQHQSDFQQPAKLLVRHILVASERDAKRVRSKLRRHNFAEMAKEYSIAPEATKGGLLPQYAKDELPKLFNIAFVMRRGQVSDILKSTYGYHFLMVEKKFKAKQLSFEEADRHIVRLLENQQKQHLYQNWVDGALSKVAIKAPKPLW